VDRWWTILIAFAVALGMVLLVMLAMGSGPTDGAAATLKPATPPVGVGISRQRATDARTGS
jgi:hypothetical protein